MGSRVNTKRLDFGIVAETQAYWSRLPRDPQSLDRADAVFARWSELLRSGGSLLADLKTLSDEAAEAAAVWLFRLGYWLPFHEAEPAKLLGRWVKLWDNIDPIHPLFRQGASDPTPPLIRRLDGVIGELREARDRLPPSKPETHLELRNWLCGRDGKWHSSFTDDGLLGHMRRDWDRCGVQTDGSEADLWHAWCRWCDLSVTCRRFDDALEFLQSQGLRTDIRYEMERIADYTSCSALWGYAANCWRKQVRFFDWRLKELAFTAGELPRRWELADHTPIRNRAELAAWLTVQRDVWFGRDPIDESLRVKWVIGVAANVDRVLSDWGQPPANYTTPTNGLEAQTLLNQILAEVHQSPTPVNGDVVRSDAVSGTNRDKTGTAKPRTPRKSKNSKLVEFARTQRGKGQKWPAIALLWQEKSGDHKSPEAIKKAVERANSGTNRDKSSNCP